MGHKEIDVRQVIAAPPAAVFATLLDRAEWPAWSGHTAFEPVRPGAAGPYDVGSVGLLRSGRRRVVREEIVEVVPGRRIGYTLLAGLSRRVVAVAPSPARVGLPWPGARRWRRSRSAAHAGA